VCLVKRCLFSLAVLCAFTLGVSCAKARHVAVQVDATVATAIFAVDDAEFAACQAHTLSQAQCDALNPKIKAALEDVKAVTAALQATPNSGTVPKTLPQLVQTLRSVQAIALALPASDVTAGLITRINTALDAAIALLSKIAGN
jgi:hypothetical protein